MKVTPISEYTHSQLISLYRRQIDSYHKYMKEGYIIRRNMSKGYNDTYRYYECNIELIKRLYDVKHHIRFWADKIKETKKQ